jgi:Flp pilus assembly CpaE family ATPase
VVVDTAKSFAPTTLAAFEQADLAFLVTNVDLASLRNIQRGLPLLRRMMGRSGDHIRLIVNRYNSDNDISLRDVEHTLGLKVFRSLSNDYEGVTRSINTGKPIVLNGDSKYGADLQALGRDVTGLKAKKQHGAGRLSALSLGKLFGRGRAEEATNP